MKNKFKDEMQNVKIPRDKIQQRITLGVDQAEETMKHKKNKKKPKWMMNIAASVILIGSTFALGGSYITEAAGTIIGQMFGSEKEFTENFPEESDNLSGIERYFELIEEQLTAEEFADFKMLMKEKAEILSKMDSENRTIPTAEEEAKLGGIRENLLPYKDRIIALTTHTVRESQQMVSYPINRPSYVPKGYELESEEARTDTMNVGEDPVVSFRYGGGPNGLGFNTSTHKLGDNEGELESYEHINSYTLKGFNFEFAYSDDRNVQGMRVKIPEEEYEITMSADILSKEEMEKILLSMIEQ